MPAGTSVRRTPVYVNVYDMIPASTLTSIGYFMGIGVFHSGVVVLDKVLAHCLIPDNNNVLQVHHHTHPDLFTRFLLGSLQLEYNFGGHEYNITGVFCVVPQVGPPGVIHKETILVGFTTKTNQEITQVIQTLSKEYTGDSYALLTRNCNHFSSDLAYRLTGSRPPAWINRAAKLGTMFPCVVPQGWVEPPTADDDENICDRETLLPRP